MKRFLIGIAIGIVFLASILGGAIGDRLFGLKVLDHWFDRSSGGSREVVKEKILTEESVVIKTVKKVGPSVVTVSIKRR